MPAFMPVCAEAASEYMGAPVGLILFFICLAVATTQLICCWKSEDILFWLLPTAVNVVCILVFFLLWVNSPDESAFYIRLNLLVTSAFTLASIGLSWGIFWLWNYIQNSSGGNPAGY